MLQMGVISRSAGVPCRFRACVFACMASAYMHTLQNLLSVEPFMYFVVLGFLCRGILGVCVSEINGGTSGCV